jgi:hypothetical protein
LGAIEPASIFVLVFAFQVATGFWVLCLAAIAGLFTWTALFVGSEARSAAVPLLGPAGYGLSGSMMRPASADQAQG